MIRTLKDPTVSLSLFYFSSLLIIGIILALLPLYCKHLGFSSIEIGIVSATFNVAEALVAIPWAIFADKIRHPQRLFTVGVALSVVFSVPFLFVRSFLPFVAAFFIFSLFQIAIYPQLEVIAVNESRAGRLDYGKPRSFGSLGVLIMTMAGAMLAQRFGITIVPVLIVGAIIFEWLTSFLIPRIVHATDHESPHLKHIKRLVLSRHILFFLVACFFAQMSHGLYYGFFSIWLSQNGYATSTIGLFWALSLCAEIVVFWKARLLFRRFSANTLLMVSFVLLALRWACFSIGASPILIIFGQVLNASFGLFHLSAMDYLHTRLPSNMKQTGQAFYNTISFGLGAAVGTTLMGSIVDDLSMRILFIVSSGLAGLGAFSFYIACRPTRLTSDI